MKTKFVIISSTIVSLFYYQKRNKDFNQFSSFLCYCLPTFLIICAINNPLSAQTIAATFTVDNKSSQIAVNPETGLIYLVSMETNSVSVVDSSTNQVIANIEVGNRPKGICINPVSNLIYVSDSSKNISVIDGQTNQIVATIESALSTIPDQTRLTQRTDPTPITLIAINPITNLIYAGSPSSSTIVVIDGLTNTVIDSISLIFNLSPSSQGVSTPIDIGTNNLTNLIYVADTSFPPNLHTIDGGSNKLINTTNLETAVTGISVNGETNRIYVAQESINIASVIDGLSSNVIATIGEDTDSLINRKVVVNSATNHIYMTDPENLKLIVIDGSTNETINFDLDEIVPGDIAINPEMNLIYVLDNLSATVTVIEDMEGIVPTPTKNIKADFIASPTLDSPPATVEFRDLSIGDITEWQWEFGDGDTSLEQNPIHVYKSDGGFSVKLTVSDSLETDTREKSDLITILPSTLPIRPTTLTVSPMTARRSLRSQKATVTLLDQDGNPMSGLEVNASTNGRQVTVTPSSAITNSNGTADFDFRFGFLSQNKEITFTITDLTATITTR